MVMNSILEKSLFILTIKKSIPLCFTVPIFLEKKPNQINSLVQVKGWMTMANKKALQRSNAKYVEFLTTLLH